MDTQIHKVKSLSFKLFSESNTLFLK